MEDFKMTGNQLYKEYHRINDESVETILELFESPAVSEYQPSYLYRFSATIQGSDITACMEMRCYELQDVEQLINYFLENYRLIALPKIRSMSNK